MSVEPVNASGQPLPSIPLHRPWFGPEEEAAVLRVIRAGELAGNGLECKRLEEDLRSLVDAKHVLAVSGRCADRRG